MIELDNEKVLFTIIGILGIVLALFGLPGVYVILGALIFAGIYDDFQNITLNTIILFGIISVIVAFSDRIVYILGAKKIGASFKSIIFGFLIGFLGLFIFGPIGFIIGLLTGTILGEYFRNPDIKESLKKGVGAFIGYIAGFIINILLTIAMYIWFLYILW